MRIDDEASDYSSLAPPKAKRWWNEQETDSLRRSRKKSLTESVESTSTVRLSEHEESKPSSRRGHTLTFCLLFAYVTIGYLRPWELTPALAWLGSVPYWLALTMLVVYAITQISLEGNFTARPREINLILILTILAIASIPQAISPLDAWTYFNGIFVKTVVLFIVLSNVVFTPFRLKAMLFLALGTGCYLSASSLIKYVASGPEDAFRAKGDLFNIFSDPNALALHLVMMVPIAVVLLISTRSLLKRIVYVAGSLVMIAGIFVTMSRGGFLAFVATLALVVIRLFKHSRALILGLVLFAAIAGVLVAPGGYGRRLSSILDPSQDAMGSADARRELLIRSIGTTLHRPLLGVGIGNFQTVSIHNQVSHNAYTQVAAEMGLPALTVYLLFLVAAYKRLRRVQTETMNLPDKSRQYYLAIGLQASLVGYVVGSFFLSVAFEWFVYFIVGYAICLSRMCESKVLSAATKETGKQTLSMSQFPATST